MEKQFQNPIKDKDYGRLLDKITGQKFPHVLIVLDSIVRGEKYIGSFLISS